MIGWIGGWTPLFENTAKWNHGLGWKDAFSRVSRRRLSLLPGRNAGGDGRARE